MRKYVGLLIMVVFAGGFLAAYGILHGRERADGSALITRALLDQSKGSYIARISTSTYYAGGRVDSSAIVYRSAGKERIDYTAPAQRGMWSITDGDSTFTYLPGQKILVESLADNKLTDQQRIRLLLSNYAASVEGTAKIAGRAASVVNLTPRSGDGPSKRLWIDNEHATVLKSIDYTASGEPRSEMRITSIRYGHDAGAGKFNISRNDAVRTISVVKPASPEALRSMLAIEVRKPAYVPAGYVFEGCYLFNCQCGCGHQAAQLTYTDGLNTLSVFMSPISAHCSSGVCGAPGKGCLLQESGIAKLGQVERGGKTVVVVGDLAPDEVRKIAESVPAGHFSGSK